MCRVLRGAAALWVWLSRAVDGTGRRRMLACSQCAARHSAAVGGTPPARSRTRLLVCAAPAATPQVPIWREDDVAALAADFGAKHGLSDKMVKRLAVMLEQQRAAVLATLATRPGATPQREDAKQGASVPQ